MGSSQLLVHFVRFALASVFAAAISLGLALPLHRVHAEVLPRLKVEIRFDGSCSANGNISIRNETTGAEVLDQSVTWSAEQPIEIRGFGGASSPDEVLRLTLRLQDGATVVFETTQFEYDDGSVFDATLVCSSVPYTPQLPDSALPLAPPHAFAGVILLVLSALLALAGMVRRPQKLAAPSS
jgi:hypothetical protein